VNIAGRTVLLTGATGGLGNAIARALTDKGAKLVMTGRRTDVLEPLAVALSGRAIAADLADRSAVPRLIADAGEVDILVANAGLPADGRVDEFTEDEIDRALDVNLRAPILLAKALSEPMVARGEGHLLFMSSLSGKVATHSSAIYSATKFGLRGFASGMRQDLRNSGVGVSAIFPGPIRDAGMFSEAEVELPRGAGTRSPEDVARAVVRAIEQNRAEIDVGSLPMRLGSSVGSFAPNLIAALNRRLGSEEIAARVAGSDYHRAKR
jgi:short-subunit dehydrogenase